MTEDSVAIIHKDKIEIVTFDESPYNEVSSNPLIPFFWHKYIHLISSLTLYKDE